VEHGPLAKDGEIDYGTEIPAVHLVAYCPTVRTDAIVKRAFSTYMDILSNGFHGLYLEFCIGI
jgi:hypothetical protein